MTIDNDRILIRDLHLRGIIGINDWEREKRQDILINLTLFTDMRAAGVSDDIADTLNYRTITKAVIEYVETSDHYTVETLATKIAGLCVEAWGRALHRASRETGRTSFCSVGWG